ncbi:MAG: hypothetical protein JXB85_13845 [Anaerolineales bacterium]|nr:hypothetical protein [Anaerolineales bacterium]
MFVFLLIIGSIGKATEELGVSRDTSRGGRSLDDLGQRALGCDICGLVVARGLVAVLNLEQLLCEAEEKAVRIPWETTPVRRVFGWSTCQPLQKQASHCNQPL